MATEIVITKNTTAGSERFDVTCEVHDAGTFTTTMDTSGKYFDRNTKVTVAVPSASASAGSGSITMTKGAGSTAATGNISLTATSSQPSSGFYIKSTGSGSVTGKGKGTVTYGEGFITAGSTTSNEASKTETSNTAEQYYTVPTAGFAGTATTVSGTTATRGKYNVSTAGYRNTGTLLNGAVFSNAPTAGKDYVDISATTDAPELASGGYLYINQGYVDDLKISLAKLIADPKAGAGATSASMLQGFQAYDKDGVLMVGSITTLDPSSTYFKDSTSGAVAASAIGAGFLSKAYYIKAGTAGAISGGGLSGGGLTQGEASGGGLSWQTPSNVTLTDTNTGISVGVNRAAFSQDVNRAKVDRAAASYSITTAGWISAAGSGLSAASIDAASSTVSLGASSTSKYISAINVPKDKPFTVTMTADTAQDTTSTLAVTSAAYRVVTINGAPGTGGGVQIEGANGKTVKVSNGSSSSASAKAVTNASGFLITASPAFAGGTPSLTDTSNAISVTGMATSETTTAYYVDATASAKATRTAVTYNGAVDGWVTKSSGASASAAQTSTAGSIAATRVYIPAATLTNTSSATFDPVVEPGSIHIDNKASASVTGKTQITAVPTTNTSDITKYYIALTSTADASDTGTAISGTVRAHVTTGYIAEQNKDYSVSGTATTSAKTSSTYYVPLATSSHTRSGNTVTWTTGWVEASSSTGDTTSRSKSTGRITAISGVTLSSFLTTTASSGVAGFYGNGDVSTGTGWVTSGTTTSNNSSTYYIIKGATANASVTPSISGAISGNYYVVTATNNSTVDVIDTAGWIADNATSTITGSKSLNITLYNGEVVA